MRYDAAVIGAGAEGLAAAIVLGQAGLRVLAIERSERAGGRCVTREFHPGFHASPFVDVVAPIPSELFRTFDLARHGAIFAAPRASLAIWPDRRHALAPDETGMGAARLLAEIGVKRREIVTRALREAAGPGRRSLYYRPSDEPWPAAEWATTALADVVAAKATNEDASAHLAALGGTADPFLPGSALRLLLADPSDGRFAGGLGRLADALLAAAKGAGVQFSFGLEATDIYRRNGRVVGVGLADGSEIEAKRVISTLDLKRTFLSFFAWNGLPKAVIRQVKSFRMAGATARVLFALDRTPEWPAAMARGAQIHVAPSLNRASEAFYALHSGVAAEDLPVTLRVVSAGDPSLAPDAGAVVTATLSAVPFRLFDGAWTHEKREALRRCAQAAVEAILPGFAAHIVGAEVIAPPDIENALGATEGDLFGGEIAGDQMLGGGPWQDTPLPRTPIPGLYLSGSHLTAGAVATCAAGVAAARALLADRARSVFG